MKPGIRPNLIRLTSDGSIENKSRLIIHKLLMILVISLYLSSTTDTDFMKAQADGGDILFMNGAGVATQLRHELEDL